MKSQTLLEQIRGREVTEIANKLQQIPSGKSISGRALQHLIAIGAVVEPLPQSIESLPAFAGIRDWSKCCLIDFSGVASGSPDHRSFPVNGLLAVPLYFEEVQDFTPISSSDLASRIEMAKDTGLLAVGPGECLAIVYRDAHGVSQCQAFEVSDTGRCRIHPNVHSFNFSVKSKLNRIAELDAQSTRHAIDETITNLAIGRSDEELSPKQIELLLKTLDLLEEHAKTVAPEMTNSGSLVKRWHCGGTDIDAVSHLRPSLAGWKRYPTANDAYFFGCWVNPVLKETLTYAEGDAAHVSCKDDIAFTKELAEMASFYGARRSPHAISYDGDGGRTSYFGAFTFLHGKVVECILSGDDGKFNPEFNGGAPLLAALVVDHPRLAALTPGESIQAEREFFSLDLCSPFAFEQHETFITKCLFGFEIQVRSETRTRIGLIKVAETDKVTA